MLTESLPPQELADQEGLRYVSVTSTGYTRKKAGKHFNYFDKNGARITDEKIIARINAIGIPPAYTDVWICPTANGHIQATGKDAKGRTQYRYHVKWREARDGNKFDHVLHFGQILPHIRQRVDQDLRLKDLSREKIMATVVSLLEKTLIRVGNAEYARDNASYGLTTLRRKHIQVSGTKITFQFSGKSGKKWNLSVNDRRIASIVKRCADIPGHELFKYIDDSGTVRDVTSSDVNAYLKEITSEDITAKDFRTWSGTVLATIALSEFEKYDSQAQAKKNIVQAIEKVASQLGNTKAVCRKCYIHPDVIDAYMTGALADMVRLQIDKKMKLSYDTLSDDEIMVLAFLKKRLGPSSKTKKKA